jgi:hypothetical protein
MVDPSSLNDDEKFNMIVWLNCSLKIYLINWNKLRDIKIDLQYFGERI